jgi:inorganic pyrophosphatase
VLHRSLPAGLFFPYDYGFVPSTVGEDGDPLDALIFADTNTFSGCVVPTRLLGVITATQKGTEGRVSNDILLAAHVDAASWKNTRNLDDLSRELLDEIEFFFTSYRNFQGQEFKVRRRRNAAFARKLLEQGSKRFQRSRLRE